MSGGGDGLTEIANRSCTLEELARYDGEDGNRCLVAVDGEVYLVEGFELWKMGERLPSGAGRDAVWPRRGDGGVAPRPQQAAIARKGRHLDPARRGTRRELHARLYPSIRRTPTYPAPITMKFGGGPAGSSACSRRAEAVTSAFLCRALRHYEPWSSFHKRNSARPRQPRPPRSTNACAEARTSRSYRLFGSVSVRPSDGNRSSNVYSRSTACVRASALIEASA